MSADQITEIVDAVFAADADGNGLSAKEVASLLEAQAGVNDDTVKAFMDACDADKDGLVSK